MNRNIIAILLTSIALLACVPLAGTIIRLFTGSESPISLEFSQIANGILAETSRAILTVWMYRYHKSNKANVRQAMVFASACSALIATLWLPLGAGLIESERRVAFLITDGLVLALQGPASGAALWWSLRCTATQADLSHEDDER